MKILRDISKTMGICAVLLTAAACKSTSHEGVSLMGEWQVRSFDNTVLSDQQAQFPTITFQQDGQINATAGCNTLAGNYTYQKGHIKFPNGLLQTQMMCDNETVMNNEIKLGQTLKDVLKVTQLGQDSLLLEGAHRMILVK